MREKALSLGQDFSSLAGMILMVMASIAAGVLLAESPVKFSLLAVASVFIIILTVRHPEVIFALFLNAGQYKGDPRFQIPHVDITILLGALTVIGVLWGVMHNRIKLKMPPFKMSFPFLAICFLSGLSLMYTSAPVYGFEKLSRFVSLTALAFFAPLYLFQVNEKGKTFPSIYRNFLISYVVLTVAMMFDIFQKGGLNTSSEEAISAFGSSYLAMGTVMSTAFLLVFLYFFMSDRSVIRRAFYILVLCPVSLYGLLISGARGPFIALVLTLVIIPIITWQPNGQSRRMASWVVLLLIAGSIYLGYAYQDFARMTYRMSLLDEGGGASALERIYMAKAALEAMSTMPYFLTGLGIGGFSEYYGGFDAARGVYPHNILLELGSEIGIAGLAAGILFLVWSYKKASVVVKKIKGEGYYIAVSATAIFIHSGINAFKSGDLNDHRILFAFLGLIYSLDYETEKPGIKEKKT